MTPRKETTVTIRLTAEEATKLERLVRFFDRPRSEVIIESIRMVSDLAEVAEEMKEQRPSIRVSLLGALASFVSRDEFSPSEAAMIITLLRDLKAKDPARFNERANRFKQVVEMVEKG